MPRNRRAPEIRGGGNPRGGTGGTEPSITAAGTDPGTITITLTDPTDWGKRRTGTALTRDDVTFWLFYQEGTVDKDAIIKAVGRADVHTTATLSDPLIAPNTIKGVIQIKSGTSHPFVITGLEPNTSYSFFLRIIHPDTTTHKHVPRAHERTKYARDTKVVEERAGRASAADKEHYALIEKLVDEVRKKLLNKAILGARGDKGDKGDTGADGATGPSGRDGAGGATGPAGARGQTGAVGATGPSGRDGAGGATGPAGARGQTGAVGATGPAGRDGADGAIGPAGRDGTDGATGPAGARGQTGADGAKGDDGDKGDKGDTGPTDMAATKSLIAQALAAANTAADQKVKALEDKFTADMARTVAPCNGTLWSPGQWCVTTIATGFNSPTGIAVAKDGTAYVADTGNHQIKQITPEGTISVIGGNGNRGNTNNPIGRDARFSNPRSIFINTTDTILYVADSDNSIIRKINLSGDFPVSSLAGTSGEGVYRMATSPVDESYFTISSPIPDRSIKQFTRNGYVNTFITLRFTTEEIAATRSTLYITSGNNIHKITIPGKRVSIFATGFNQPKGIAVAPNGTLYVVEGNRHLIKQLTLKRDGTLNATTTIAGSGTAGSTNAAGTTAQFNSPQGIAVAKDKNGNTLLYVVDTGNNSIRKLEYKE